MVANVWDDTREDGGWLPIFLRSLNDWEMERFLNALHRQKISPSNVDKLLLKGYRDESLSTKRMDKVVDQSPDNRLPFSFYLEVSCPSQNGFFRLGSYLG